MQPQGRFISYLYSKTCERNGCEMNLKKINLVKHLLYAKKILLQVDFYFSDVNILKDAFLLKHVRRNKAGFVSLKLITSFKKVKTLTKDYRDVAYALRKSQELKVNEEGTKVCRIKPLPEYDETTPSRTVVAVNLPMENPTIESVAEMFSGCGDIALIRILRPGKPVPPDVKYYSSKHPELGNTVCSVVEFETHSSALKASRTFHNQADWRSGMRVLLLSAKKEKKKATKKNKKKEKGTESDGNTTSDVENDKKKVPHRKNSRVNELAQKPSYECSSGSEGDEGPRVGRVRAHSAGNIKSRTSLSPNHAASSNRLSPNASPKTSPRSSPRGSPTSRRKQHGRSPLAAGLSPSQSPRNSPRASPEMRKRTTPNSNGKQSDSDRPSSPWVQRRILLKAQDASAPANSTCTGSSPKHSPLMGRRLPDGSLPPGAPPPRMANMVGLIREPRGPDGTRGFHQKNRPTGSDNAIKVST